MPFYDFILEHLLNPSLGDKCPYLLNYLAESRSSREETGTGGCRWSPLLCVNFSRFVLICFEGENRVWLAQAHLKKLSIPPQPLIVGLQAHHHA